MLALHELDHVDTVAKLPENPGAQRVGERVGEPLPEDAVPGQHRVGLRCGNPPQLRGIDPPPGYAALLRDGILRERFADTLTDAVRASLLRAAGYKVDVVEFVESAHTPRNTLVRATRTGVVAGRDEYDELVTTWGVRPRLGELLADRPGDDG